MIDVFLADGIIALILFVLVAIEAYRLIAAWRARKAGARLHAYIVGLFSITAAIPAVIMAVVGSVALERGLYPAFMEDVRGFISHTADAARLYRAAQCNSLLREADLTASDLDRAKVGYNDRSFFQNYFASRVHSLGFTTAVIMKADGSVSERVDTGRPVQVAKPEPTDFADARNHDPVCFVLEGGKTFVALRHLPSFDDSFLYVGRPIDPFAVEFPQQAHDIIALYDVFDAHRKSIQIAFIIMYGLLAVIMLLSAIWLGLSFANQLVAPIRRLINATDQVSSGNLLVQVPVRRSEGDLARLGETFNKMTSELLLQQNRLIAARETIDERRLFTEAVLSGVPAAVIGIDSRGGITVLNPSASKILAQANDPDVSIIGQSLTEVVPELRQIVEDARAGRQRLQHGQVTLTRGGRDRTFNVRVTSDLSAKVERGYVVTLDDITDLITAQRTSAWADVARRIAHEIKNPLTPIQLSAERLKRRYSKVITEGRDVFDQCTDTIIRQVDDLKRMVDEFSSFARMPKAVAAGGRPRGLREPSGVPDARREPSDHVRGGLPARQARGAIRSAAYLAGPDQHHQERGRRHRGGRGWSRYRRSYPGFSRRQSGRAGRDRCRRQRQGLPGGRPASPARALHDDPKRRAPGSACPSWPRSSKTTAGVSNCSTHPVRTEHMYDSTSPSKSIALNR